MENTYIVPGTILSILNKLTHLVSCREVNRPRELPVCFLGSERAGAGTQASPWSTTLDTLGMGAPPPPGDVLGKVQQRVLRQKEVLVVNSLC